MFSLMHLAAAVVDDDGQSQMTNSPMLEIHPHPVNNPGLEANRICRIVLGIIGSLLCWVPLRLLASHREFATVVLIIDVLLLNFFNILNALIWPNDNWDRWWDGYGLCDIEAYVLVPIDTLFAACIFVIMRNLAGHLRLRRAADLTPRERKRQHIVEALILFMAPVLQLAATWFLLAQRYVIGAVVGCIVAYEGSWFQIIVFDVPALVFSLGTILYAYLTWKRFREITKTTQTVLASNSVASFRAQRARRRLYQMSLSIVVPYVPMQVVLFALSVGNMRVRQYDYQGIHDDIGLYPWNSIMFIPSWLLDFPTMNQPWVAVLTTIPIVAFFGMTTEAIDIYRRFLLHLGFGRFFEALEDPYDPGRVHSSNDTTTQGLFGGRYARETHVSEESPCVELANRRKHLPNAHHQIIISSTGPFIPPRHSSSFSRPIIPPRSSSVQPQKTTRTSPLKRIQIPIKMPSLSSLSNSIRSSLRRGNRDMTAGDEISSTMSTRSQPSAGTAHADGLPLSSHRPALPYSTTPSAQRDSSSGSEDLMFPPPRSHGTAHWSPRDGLEWSYDSISQRREAPPTGQRLAGYGGPAGEDGEAGQVRSAGFPASSRAAGNASLGAAGFRRIPIRGSARAQLPDGDEDVDEQADSPVRSSHI